MRCWKGTIESLENPRGLAVKTVHQLARFFGNNRVLGTFYRRNMIEFQPQGTLALDKVSCTLLYCRYKCISRLVLTVNSNILYGQKTIESINSLQQISLKLREGGRERRREEESEERERQEERVRECKRTQRTQIIK